MEENIICKGKFSKINIPFIICILITAFFLGKGIYNQIMEFQWFDVVNVFNDFWYRNVLPNIIIGVVFLGVSIFLYLLLSKCEISVSDKRVVGISSLRRRVELPLDKISAIQEGMFNSIKISTSSGKVAFYLLQNRDEVREAISKLTMQRQG